MGSAATILVVDDEPQVREVIATILATRYQVQTAGTAEAALDLLAVRHFDLILLDYRLPDILGTAVLETITRFYPQTAVLLMTGYGTEEIAIQALRAGARDYLRKPLDFHELLARVDTLLSARPAERLQREATALRPSAPETSRPGPALSEGIPSILKALQHIETHLDTQLVLPAIAGAAGVTLRELCHLFRAVTGLGLREYLLRRRIAQAQRLLRETGRPLGEILHGIGFRDLRRFQRLLRRLEGRGLPPELGSLRIAGGVDLERPDE